MLPRRDQFHDLTDRLDATTAALDSVIHVAPETHVIRDRPADIRKLLKTTLGRGTAPPLRAVRP